jgi:DNA-binding NarL/FixJ family response regulator
MLGFYFVSHRRVRNQESTGQESEPVASEHIRFNKNLKTRLRIRVVVADDHPVMRTGLSQIINQQEDMEIIGLAENGEEAAKITLQVKPDVVLMDVVMPVLDGIGATRKIISERPETCIIGLTLHEDPLIDGKMKLAGATQCLTKSCPTEVLLDAIRSCTSSMK